MDERKRRNLGIAAVAVGLVILTVGVLWAHFTGLPEVDNVGREIYPAIPRHWSLVLIGQIVALAGGQLAIIGVVVAYLYDRPLTWARASVGAALFTLQAMILFGIIPNEWLTLTQSELEWTPQRIAFTIPPWLVLNNDIQISYSAIKDIVSGTYSLIALVGTAGAMIWWQERQKKLASGPPPTVLSEYGRPVVKPVRSLVETNGGGG